MARLNILIPLLAVLLVIAHTSYASKWQEHDSCSKQLKNVNLKHCENLIKQKFESEEDKDNDDMIRIRGIILPKDKKEKEKVEEEEEQLQKCCNNLSELENPSCQCRALKKIMDKQSEKLQGMEHKLEQELTGLSMKCGVGPLFGCDLSSDN